MYKTPVNNGICYQPQLVSRISSINSSDHKHHHSRPSIEWRTLRLPVMQGCFVDSPVQKMYTLENEHGT